MPELSTVRTLMAPLVGTAYEPWAQLIWFLVVVVAAWAVIAWLVMRPQSRALGHLIYTGVQRGVHALDQSHAFCYAPELERLRQRAAPYVELGTSLTMTGLMLLPTVTLAVFLLAFYDRAPWYQSVYTGLYMSVCVLLGRKMLVYASRAWHRIQTGQEDPGRHCRPTPETESPA
jgi:hypothetical protein